MENGDDAANELECCNKFACNVNEQVIRATADAIAANGIRQAGYDYVVIDDCWHGSRDANGFITEDRQRFPSDPRAQRRGSLYHHGRRADDSAADRRQRRRHHVAGDARHIAQS
ncbi:hypothetical protein ASE59_05835 [Sphingomonas sp. Leaf10]|nr:hypothetical protein ASE59_05835 [Sphingomonas sp. Leaf10]